MEKVKPKKEPQKPPSVKYEDTNRFKVLDLMMRQNRGIRWPGEKV